MAKKTFDYFVKLSNQMALCKKAAEQLVSMLENYTDVSIRAEEIHITEHDGDDALHEIMWELNRSFITPIDREDIIRLATELDNINDAIEDVANLFDMLSIKEVKPEAKTMANLILQGCNALSNAVDEFRHFKRSKKLSDLIIKVHKVEEDGDRMHRSIIKSLFKNEPNAIELMKWTQLFDSMEDVLDFCEDVAETIDGLVIKNS